MAHFKNKLIDISRFDIFLNAGFWCCFWLLYVYSVCNNVTTHEYIDGLSDYFGNIPAIIKLIISMRVMIDGLWLLGHEIQSYIQHTKYHYLLWENALRNEATLPWCWPFCQCRILSFRDLHADSTKFCGGVRFFHHTYFKYIILLQFTFFLSVVKCNIKYCHLPSTIPSHFSFGNLFTTINAESNVLVQLFPIFNTFAIKLRGIVP